MRRFVALPKHRRTVGVLLAAFFAAIFPGNVAQYVEGTDAFGLDTDRARLSGSSSSPARALGAVGRGAARPAAQREARGRARTEEVDTGE